MSAPRLNALVAVELDAVRRHERMCDLRLAAAVILAPTVAAAEALLAGVPVPRSRLDNAWVRALRLTDDLVLLDEELALRVAGHGPLEPSRSSRASSPYPARRWEGGGRKGGHMTSPDVWEESPRWQLRPLSKVTPRQTRWLFPGLFPLRYITLVAAVGGLGKSHWLLALAAQGSVAAEPWDTIYVSFEDTAEEVLRPRLEAAGGNPDRVHELTLTDADDLTSFSLPRDIEDLQWLVQASSARLIVIDPIVASIDTQLDAYKDQHVRQVLTQLWRITKEEDCAVAIVGHLNRVSSSEAYLRIANSMAFWNAARSVVLITPDGSDEDGLRLIAQRKANLARLAPIERHVLEEIVLPDTVDPETGKPIVTSRMRFLEIADDINPSDILGPPTPTKTDRAEQLLEAVLADGEWHESGAVKHLLDAAGYPERTVKRAARDLGIEHERRGFPSVTWWRLPVGPSPVGPTPRSESGPTGDAASSRGSEEAASSVGPIPLDLGDGPTDGPSGHPLIGGEGFLPHLYAALEAGRITEEEWHQADRTHRFVVAVEHVNPDESSAA